MRRLTALLLAVLTLMSSASALELTDEAFALWNAHLHWLVDHAPMRLIASPDEQKARQYLHDGFVSMGFSQEEETLLLEEVSVDFVDDPLYNLVAILPAQHEDAQIITLCAHFDSLAPGARDNASGVAALMTLADLFARQGPYEDTELRFVAFTGEEYGRLGSLIHCEEMDGDAWLRSLAVFNLDIVTVGLNETNHAFSMDTLGMRTEDGDYIEGDDDEPAYNRPALALLRAMDELGAFPKDEEAVTWCGPRTLGMSDHESFHLIGVDAVNVCFRGTTESGGAWPAVMHTPDDLYTDLDLTRTWNALNAVYTAVDGLAKDHEYGM